jgi:G3E family GTPase
MTDDASDPDEVPITLLCGPLGAGKTTLVNRLVADPGGRRIAVVVNDMGELNVDAELLAGETDEGVVDLSNGCICCRLQDDLVTSVTRLADERSFDYLVVEASGISEPVPIARTLTVGTDAGRLPEHFRLDTVVSVVDAYGFWKAFDPAASLPEAAPAPERPLTEVLVDQVEFCDVLLLNKCDLVPADELDAIERAIRELQPRAALHRTTHSEVPPATVLDTGRFDFEDASRNQGWKRTLAAAEDGGQSQPDDKLESSDQSHGHDGATGDGDRDEDGDGDGGVDDHGHGHDHDHGDEPAAAAHGVDSFVYRSDRPFDPAAFDRWLDDWDGDILRLKGFAWVASRPDEVLGVSQAGPTVQAGPIGEWGDGTPATRLVIIGRDLDVDAITAALDAVTTEATDASGTAATDPFPREP